MKILLDTSFLIYAMQDNIDILSELRKFGKARLYTSSLVVDELKRFSEGRGRKAKNARLSLGFIERAGIEVIGGVQASRAGGGNTDKNIVATALEEGMAVCTADRKLKKTLKENGVNVVTIRQGKYLVGES